MGNHAAVRLSSQSLLVSGGHVVGGVLADCWILDLSTMTWREVGDWCMAVLAQEFPLGLLYSMRHISVSGNMLVNFEPRILLVCFR